MVIFAIVLVIQVMVASLMNPNIPWTRDIGRELAAAAEALVFDHPGRGDQSLEETLFERCQALERLPALLQLSITFAAL